MSGILCLPLSRAWAALCAGYKKYTDVEGNSIPLKTPGPTTQMIGDLPYERLQRPMWFPDRHDGVTTPTVRRFASEDRSAATSATVLAQVVTVEPAAGSSVGCRHAALL